MKKISVKASSSYDISIGSGILADTGKIVSEVLPPCRAALISDSNVMPLYGAAVKKSLEAAGYKVLSFTFDSGEKSKSFGMAGALLDFFSQCGLTRGDIVIALGGGVTGDLTGFAASIYLRGIKYVQIPTSLLAAVDSSVGGKTGVDLPAGKNLAGAFWQPSAVICDTHTFKTLPAHYISDGMAEVVKYGIIADNKLFDSLKSLSASDIDDEIVATCVSIKRDIVEKDEFDKGERLLLNFGHTIGHAIEKLSNYKISHGHAVAAGMACMARASEALGIAEKPCAAETEALLRSLNLPAGCDFTSDELTRAALVDKKIKGDKITIVVPKEIGRAVLHCINVGELDAFISAGLK